MSSSGGGRRASSGICRSVWLYRDGAHFGHLHDIRKLSCEFQAYIRGERATGGDHSSAGARVAYDAYPYPLGKILAAIIAAHHAGLADGADLGRRVDAAKDKFRPDGKCIPGRSRPGRR